MDRVPVRIYGALFACLLLFGTALRVDANVESPQEMLEAVTAELFAVLERELETIKRQPRKMFDLVEQVLLPHVDMQVMSRFVLGKHWRSASAEQQRLFSVEFKNLMVRFYVSAILDRPDKLEQLLAGYGNSISFLPTKIDEPTRKTTVRAEVRIAEGKKLVPVSFSLFKRSGKWLVYDINVDGISLVNNYRSNFSGEVKRGGLDNLILGLAKRNSELLEKYDSGDTVSIPEEKSGE